MLAPMVTLTQSSPQMAFDDMLAPKVTLKQSSPQMAPNPNPNPLTTTCGYQGHICWTYFQGGFVQAWASNDALCLIRLSQVCLHHFQLGFAHARASNDVPYYKCSCPLLEILCRADLSYPSCTVMFMPFSRRFCACLGQ